MVPELLAALQVQKCVMCFCQGHEVILTHTKLDPELDQSRFKCFNQPREECGNICSSCFPIVSPPSSSCFSRIDHLLPRTLNYTS